MDFLAGYGSSSDDDGDEGDGRGVPSSSDTSSLHPAPTKRVFTLPLRVPAGGDDCDVEDEQDDAISFADDLSSSLNRSGPSAPSQRKFSSFLPAPKNAGGKQSKRKSPSTEDPPRSYHEVVAAQKSSGGASSSSGDAKRPRKQPAPPKKITSRRGPARTLKHIKRAWVAPTRPSSDGPSTADEDSSATQDAPLAPTSSSIGVAPHPSTDDDSPAHLPQPSPSQSTGPVASYPEVSSAGLPPQFQRELLSLGFSMDIPEVRTDDLCKHSYSSEFIEQHKAMMYKPPTSDFVPTRTQKSRNQITYLANQAQDSEARINALRSKSMLTKAQTWGKYGW